MSALSDLLRENIPDGWSNREIARRSNGALSRATVDKYLSDRHGRPTPEVIQAFHDVLQIPLERLREAAALPIGEAEPWTPPEEANLMSHRQRAAVEELIRSFVTASTELEVTATLTADAEVVESPQRPVRRRRQPPPPVHPVNRDVEREQPTFDRSQMLAAMTEPENDRPDNDAEGR